MSEFFAMGGHAFYVWGAYLAAALLLLADILPPVLRLGQLRDALRRRQKKRSTGED